MRTYGIAIPTYQRDHMVEEAYRDVAGDVRVQSIAIVDDGSTGRVPERLRGIRDPKVSVVLHPDNVGCYMNKRRAMLASEQAGVILLDSDNTISRSYLDALDAVGALSKDVLYMPVFARPAFDYRDYLGLSVSRNNIRGLVDMPRFLTALNTGNFFVHRRTYLEVFDACTDPMAADSIYFVYCWLRAGKRLYFTPDLVYNHRVHGGSNYVAHAERTRPFMQELERKLRVGEWI